MRDDSYYHGDREKKQRVRGVNPRATGLWDGAPDAESEGTVEQRQRDSDDGPQRVSLGISNAVESLLEAIFG